MSEGCCLRTKTCCFCLPIRTGAIMIAVFGIVGSVLSTISFFSTVMVIDMNSPKGVFSMVNEVPDPVFQIIKNVVSVLVFIFNIFLLVGVRKNDKYIVSLWIASNVVLLGLMVLIGIVLVILYFEMDLYVFGVPLGISVISLQIYSLWIVYKFEEGLKWDHHDDQDGPEVSCSRPTAPTEIVNLEYSDTAL